MLANERSSDRAATVSPVPEAAGTTAALRVERHEEALAFVEELVAPQPRSRWRWLGPDPAETIEHALKRVWPTGSAS